MTTSSLLLLSTCVREETDSILRRWAKDVMQLPSARGLDHPTLIDHMPTLVAEICNGLQKHEEPSIHNGSSNDPSEAHGVTRFQAGFDLIEVVAEYNALREVLVAFAEERGISLDGYPGRVLHRSIDHAIAFAAKAYAE